MDKTKIAGQNDVEAFNKLMRYTGYRSFLNLLELRGLGKENRFRLPACVVISIRNKFPSISGHYTGFKDVNVENILMFKIL